MGFHPCRWCEDREDADSLNKYSRYSSGDVTLIFPNGDAWEMPDMILHYVADHG